jgi:small subunit ribosomal protein S14
VQKYAAKRAQLKELIRSPRTSDEERAEAQVKLQKLPRDASPTRGRNRCAITGRSAWRVPQVRPLAHQDPRSRNRGEIPGVVKSSW